MPAVTTCGVGVVLLEETCAMDGEDRREVDADDECAGHGAAY